MPKKTNGRVKIPTNVKEQLETAQKVYDQHLNVGGKSILNALDGYDWAISGPQIAECLKQHNDAEMFKSKMEQAYEQRDKTLPEIMDILRASSSILKAQYSKTPKKLGEWGLNVDDTPKVKKDK